MKIENKHERDEHVKMHPDYDENHIYLINGESHLELGYKSVTRFMEKFFSKFDADKIINKYYDNWQKRKHEKYFGLTKEEIVSLWENKGKVAREEGTIMHAMFEDYANEDEIDYELDEIQNFIIWFDSEVSKPFRTEYTVYGEDEMIVGNIDFIYLNKNGETCLVDYKRTDVPDGRSYGRKCIGIDMPDTKEFKHVLQLNLYKYLLEKYYDLDITHIYNLYIKEDNCKFVEQDIIDMGEIIDGK